MTTDNLTIAQYLIKRLYDYQARHIFGIPGDYILNFVHELSLSPIQYIGTTREDAAAFAADGYARCQGIGALVVTYGVGALSTVNAVAGAYAESSPVVVISGAPGIKEQRDDPLLHHRFGPFAFQREIFERITCATAVLDDAVTAFRQIDRVLQAAKHFCKPVYIELPRDMVKVTGYSLPFVEELHTFSDTATLQEAVTESLTLLKKAKSPVIIAGVEVHRRGLQNLLIDFVQKSGLPVATTLTGKSVISERHPAYLGIYEGAMSSEQARSCIEQADFILMLGVTLNDVDTGIYTACLNPNCTVRAVQNEVIIHHHRYPRITLVDFLTGLTQQVEKKHFNLLPDYQAVEPLLPSSQPITIATLITFLNQALTPNMMAICDTGDCLFASLELHLYADNPFLAAAFYTTMGFAVPAALGAQVASPDRRAVILVGDGAFQMSGTELSSHIRLGLAPIVIVFNNRGYNTERFILDGFFNDIADWQFDKLGEVFPGLQSFDIHTEQEFVDALNQTINDVKPSLLNVHLSSSDPSPAMKRLTEHLRKRL
jgi:TPP-dependent 2-oxoacid decarboxylase